MEGVWYHHEPAEIRPSLHTGWPSKEETDHRGHHEANGNFERATCLYGKDWSSCARDNTIPSTPQVWPVRYGVKKEAITLKSLPWVLFEQWEKTLWRFWSDVAKCFVVWRNQDGTFWPKCKTLCLAQTQHSTSRKEHHPYCEVWWWQHHVMGMFLISRDWATCQDRRDNGWSKIQKNREENLPTRADRLITRAFTLTTNLLLDAGWRYNKRKRHNERAHRKKQV